MPMPTYVRHDHRQGLRGSHGAVLGHVPQHLQFEGGKSYLKAGDRNVFREYSSVHRGFKEGSSNVIATTIF